MPFSTGISSWSFIVANFSAANSSVTVGIVPTPNEFNICLFCSSSVIL